MYSVYIKNDNTIGKNHFVECIGGKKAPSHFTNMSRRVLEYKQDKPTIEKATKSHTPSRTAWRGDSKQKRITRGHRNNDYDLTCIK